jgi:hypothetical protein
MVIRTKKEFITGIPEFENIVEIQDSLNFVRYTNLSAHVKVMQSQVNKISSSINKRWWEKNSKRIMTKSGR